MLIGNKLLKRYHLLKRLGQGGFGDTYLAEDIALPDHPHCVVKHLRPHSNDNAAVFQTARRLFDSEAKILYDLGEKNPQIPRLYAHFEEAGNFYLVQEFIDGHDLTEEIIERNPLTEQQTVKLLQEILEIVAFVHQENVIHRDIKPSNIMRRTVDGKLVLIDFGAVKKINGLSESGEETILTIVIGTPGYMPSEQYQGFPKLSSDVYAIGNIAIEALTGMKINKLRDSNTGEIIWRDKVNISKKFVNVLDKMVCEDYKLRYHNASEALQAVVNIINSPHIYPEQKHSKTFTTKQSKNLLWFPGLLNIFQYLTRFKEEEIQKSISSHSQSRQNNINSVTDSIASFESGVTPKIIPGDVRIVRKQAKQLEMKFAQAISNISKKSIKDREPVVFHVYGIGGVGKTTLLRDLQQENIDKSHFVEFSFELNLGSDTPLKFMEKLYSDVEKTTKLPFSFWRENQFSKPDPFTYLYQQYKQTLQKLENQSTDGKKSASPEQIDTVKKIVKYSRLMFGQLMPGTTPVLDKVAEIAVDTAPMLLSFRQLLQEHEATRHNFEIQELILDPLPKLTQAFAEGLILRAKKHPLILMMDGYEKVSQEIDSWLWYYLLANTDLKYSNKHNVRLFIAGRFSILKNEGWRRLKQDYQLIFERNLDKFDKNQTQTYLSKFNISQSNSAKIYTITKGLPYYLNWIREQKEKGIELDLSIGSHEIVNVLLYRLNPAQKRIVQLAACCHWFDQPLIQYLIKQQTDYLTTDEQKSNWFEWLRKRDYVKVVQYNYRFDDVARDLFRLSLKQENEDLFYKTHTFLASYFSQKADNRVSSDSSPYDRLENPDWCNYTAESWYHTFFSESGDSQRKFLNEISKTHILRESQLMIKVLTAISAEADIKEHPLLLHESRTLLQTIGTSVADKRICNHQASSTTSSTTWF